VPGRKNDMAARVWSSQHGGDGVLRVSEEAVMITGDGNLVELQGSVRYSITDPRVYLFEVSDLNSLLRSAAESVLRETIAGETFAELLTTDRAAFQDEVLRRLKDRCVKARPEGLGIRLEGVSLHDLHPPQEVVQSYHEVTKAMEKRDRVVNEAQAAALSSERAQDAKKRQAVLQAEAAAADAVKLAEARQAEFLARYRARTEPSTGQEWELLREALHAYADGQDPEAVVRDYQKRRGELVAARAVLVDFARYWEALSAALAGREKIIIDADKVPGRTHLWMVPIEPFRFPIPAMTMPRRPSEEP
jgi:regulator of protease activity HflC (stomatin/prohibitin superfamily)